MPNNNQTSIVWDSDKDCFVIWGGSGATLTTVTPPASGSPYAGSTWTLGTLTNGAGGATPTNGATNGTNKRFLYVSSATVRGYLLLNGVADPIYFYRTN